MGNALRHFANRAARFKTHRLSANTTRRTSNYTRDQSDRPHPRTIKMSSLASCALRKASRQAASAAASPLGALPRAALVATRCKPSRRGYVTETKHDQARVETAIKLDKKDFLDIPPPQMGVPTDAKVSPMAGMRKSCFPDHPCSVEMLLTFDVQKY